jgi:hypothetical protein
MSLEHRPAGKLVQESLRLAGGVREPEVKKIVAARYEKALTLLPDEVLDLFVSGKRKVRVIVMPDPKLPMGMLTRSEGTPRERKYTIFLYEEHGTWPADRFLGALLRELGHVVANRPPENEWPEARGDRARFKEMLECRADAMVWRWGLRHYSMSYLVATFPQHWVERIVKEIGDFFLKENWEEYD